MATLFMDPVRACPLTAIAYRNLMDIRRILRRSSDRTGQFFMNLELAMEGTLDGVNGPAHGLISLARALDCTLCVSNDRNEVALVSCDAGRTINLLTDDGPLLRWNLRDFASRSILKGRVQRIIPDGEGNCQRKDVQGITTVIDRHATLGLVSCPGGCDVDAARMKFALRIILSGSPMYGDGLHAAKLIADASCDAPGCDGVRCTTEHWCYDCCKNQANRDRFIREVTEVIRLYASARATVLLSIAWSRSLACGTVAFVHILLRHCPSFAGMISMSKILRP